ncbi:MAG: hypothetical protein R6V62_01285 [Candidatus Fermentibacteraceae bacterium]
MTSRLALFPLLGALILLAGRGGIGIRHLIAGGALALAACLGLLTAHEPVTGVPYAVRWVSFGLMLAGFGGTTAKWGFGKHLDGLVAAAALVSLLMVILGADAVSGNSNRTGLLLSLGVVAALADGNRTRALFKCALILPGLLVSAFYISWLAALLGAAVLYTHKRFPVNPGWLLVLMMAGQALFTAMPLMARRIGPTVELRTLIWRTSATLGLNAFPAGTGTGQARLSIYTDGGGDLQNLAGADRRVDFLHSEPLTLFTEFGAAGLTMLALLLLWVFRTRWEPLTAALLSAFWLVFMTDLPLATPLGALPAAFVIGGCLKPGRTVRVPGFVPAALAVVSIPWAYTVIKGYGAMNHPENPRSASEACRYIPFEERAFLNSGWGWLRSGSALQAREYSQRFTELYPHYHGGWELQAGVLSQLNNPQASASAWRRAFVLAPVGLHDRLLFALNGIPHSENSGDTLVLLGNSLAGKVPWRIIYPEIPQEGYAETALRYLALAMNLRSGEPELAGELFSRAVILMGYDPGLSWSRFQEEALLCYPLFRDLVPGIHREKVESLIATL